MYLLMLLARWYVLYGTILISNGIGAGVRLHKHTIDTVFLSFFHPMISALKLKALPDAHQVAVLREGGVCKTAPHSSVIILMPIKRNYGSASQ